MSEQSSQPHPGKQVQVAQQENETHDDQHKMARQKTVGGVVEEEAPAPGIELD